jgi:two-component system response regulator HydG
VQSIAEPVLKAMLAYDWPGNVRELRNFVESMVVLDRDGVLNLDDVEDGGLLRKMHLADGPAAGPAGLVGRPLAEVERYYIEQALQLAGGNREEAARMLGIGERTLYRKIKEWQEQDQVRKALDENGGDLAAAARALNRDEAELGREVKKWGLREEG